MTREELDEKLNGRRLVVSVSGGKDSTAVCLFLKDLGFQPDEYERVFFDTGWEHSLAYEYLQTDLPPVVGPITWLRAEVPLSADLEPVARRFEKRLGVEYSAMVRLCLKNSMFPARTLRFCTTHLKVFPARDYLCQRENAVVNVVGIRAQESAARALMLEWEYSGVFKCDTWRPLLTWSETQVIQLHQKHGVRPCRLYLEQGSTRVGCSPCIYARKAEIRALSDFSPERVQLIADLEEELAQRAKTDPTWFHQKNAGPVPIAQVVKWSKTTRGGSVDQLELFTDPLGHQGCVRWGMCETPTND